MNKVRITAIRQTVYPDLMAKYENPIEHACDVREGQEWESLDIVEIIQNTATGRGDRPVDDIEMRIQNFE